MNNEFCSLTGGVCRRDRRVAVETSPVDDGREKVMIWQSWCELLALRVIPVKKPGFSDKENVSVVPMGVVSK